MLGVVSALLLVIVTSGMPTRPRDLELTNRSMAYELRVDLAGPLPPAELIREVRGLAGVGRVEPGLLLPVLLRPPKRRGKRMKRSPAKVGTR